MQVRINTGQDPAAGTKIIIYNTLSANLITQSARGKNTLLEK